MATETSSAGTGGRAAYGERIMALAERLARWSETPDGLTCTYLTPAHRAVAAQLRDWMRDAGLTAQIDAVGNVVDRYHPATPGAKYLLTGSHYDTVRNGGKYDGRLGIFVPMACVQKLHAAGQRLPFGIEVVGFAEEEGHEHHGEPCVTLEEEARREGRGATEGVRETAPEGCLSGGWGGEQLI